MQRIPRVRTWKVTFEHAGTTDSIRVEAPTKLLARMVFRDRYGFAPIVSVGLIRRVPS